MITSAIPFAAVARTSSALVKPSLTPKLPYISLNLLLLITTNESTLPLSFSRPKLACSVLIFPSKMNGIVTIPTVKIPISIARLDIMGAAPVPVPPPIPAVIKTILVLLSSIFLITSKLSIAAFSPIFGSAPAPIPSVKLIPSCTLFGTGLFSSA